MTCPQWRPAVEGLFEVGCLKKLHYVMRCAHLEARATQIRDYPLHRP